jgi:hypothetical protein
VTPVHEWLRSERLALHRPALSARDAHIDATVAFLDFAY